MDSSDEEDELSAYLNKSKTEVLEKEKSKPVSQSTSSSATIDEPKSSESTSKDSTIVKFRESVLKADIATDDVIAVSESLVDSKVPESNRGIKSNPETGVEVKSQTWILEQSDKSAEIASDTIVDQDSNDNDLEIPTDFSYIEPDIDLAEGFEVLNNPLVDYDTDVFKNSVTSSEHCSQKITNNIDNQNNIEPDDNQTDITTKQIETQDVQLVETHKQSDLGDKNIPQGLTPSRNIDFVSIENIKPPTESSHVPENQNSSSMMKSFVVGSFDTVEPEKYLKENPATGIDMSSVEVKTSEPNNANPYNYNESSTAEMNKLLNKESYQSTTEATTSNSGPAVSTSSSGNRFVVLREEDWRAFSEALNQTWNESTRSAMRALTLMNIVSKLGIPVDLDDNSNTQPGGSNSIANAKGSNCQHVNNSAKSEHKAKTETELSEKGVKVDSYNKDKRHDAISKNVSDFSNPDRTLVDKIDKGPSSINQASENIRQSTNSTTECVRSMDKSLSQNETLSHNKTMLQNRALLQNEHQAKVSSFSVALDSGSKADSQDSLKNKRLSHGEVKSVPDSTNQTRKSADSTSGIRNNRDLYDDTKSKCVSEKVSNVTGSSLLSSGRFVRKGNKLVFQRGLSMKDLNNVEQLPDATTAIVEKESNTGDTEGIDSHDTEFSDNENAMVEISEGSDDENVITIEINPPEKHIADKTKEPFLSPPEKHIADKTEKPFLSPREKHIADETKAKTKGSDVLDVSNDQAKEKSNSETRTKQLKNNNANYDGFKDFLSEKVYINERKKILDSSQLRFVEDGVVKIKAMGIISPTYSIKSGEKKPKSWISQSVTKMPHKAVKKSVTKKPGTANKSKWNIGCVTKISKAAKQTLQQKYKSKGTIACDNEDLDRERENVESNDINTIDKEKKVDFENEKETLNVDKMEVKQHAVKTQENKGKGKNLIKGKTKNKATKGSKVNETNDSDKDVQIEPEKSKKGTTRKRATKSLNVKESGSVCFETSLKKAHVTDTVENESIQVKQDISSIKDSNSGQNKLDISEPIKSEPTSAKPKTSRKKKGGDGENKIQSKVKSMKKKDSNINESIKSNNDSPDKQQKPPVQKRAPKKRKVNPEDTESNSDELKQEMNINTNDDPNCGQNKLDMSENESIKNENDSRVKEPKAPVKKRTPRKSKVNPRDTESNTDQVKQENIDTINYLNSGQNKPDMSENESIKNENDTPVKEPKAPVKKRAPRKRKVNPRDTESNTDQVKQKNIGTINYLNSGQNKPDMSENESIKNENDTPVKEPKAPVKKRAPRKRKVNPKDTESNSDKVKQENIDTINDHNGGQTKPDISEPIKSEPTSSKPKISRKSKGLDEKNKIQSKVKSEQKIDIDINEFIKPEKDSPDKQHSPDKQSKPPVRKRAPRKRKVNPKDSESNSENDSLKREINSEPDNENVEIQMNKDITIVSGEVMTEDIKLPLKKRKVDILFDHMEVTATSDNNSLDHDTDTKANLMKHSESDSNVSDTKSIVKRKRSRKKKTDAPTVLSQNIPDSVIESDGKPMNTKSVEKKKQASELPKLQTNDTLMKDNVKDTEDGNHFADTKNDEIDKELSEFVLKSSISKKRKTSKADFEESDGDLIKTKEKVTFRDASPKKKDEKSPPQKRGGKHSDGKDEPRRRKHVNGDDSWKEMLSGDEFKDEFDNLQVSPVKHINVRKVIKGILKPKRDRGKNGKKIEKDWKEIEDDNSTGEGVRKYRNKQSKQLADEILANLKKRNGGGLDSLKNSTSEKSNDVVKNSGVQIKVQTASKPSDPETVQTKGVTKVLEKSETLLSTIRKDTVRGISDNLNGKIVIVEDRLNSRTISIGDSPVKSTSEKSIIKPPNSNTVWSQKPSSDQTLPQFSGAKSIPAKLPPEFLASEKSTTKFSDSITVSSQTSLSRKTSAQFPSAPSKSLTAKMQPKVLDNEKTITKLPDSIKSSIDKISAQFLEFKTSSKQSTTAKPPPEILSIVKTPTAIIYNISRPSLPSQSPLKETNDTVKASANVSTGKLVKSPLSDSVAKLKSLLDKAVG